jgi:hypothetical protein
MVHEVNPPEKGFLDRLDKIVELLEEQNKLLRTLTRTKQPYNNRTGTKRG